MVITRLYAPSTRERAARIWPSGSAAVVRAIRCTITSESEEDWKIAPCSTSSRLSSAALVRLPLCARAGGRPPGGGVAGVAHRPVAGEIAQLALVEDFPDQAHAAEAVGPALRVHRDDAGALLAAVLQRSEEHTSELQ